VHGGFELGVGVVLLLGSWLALSAMAGGRFRAAHSDDEVVAGWLVLPAVELVELAEQEFGAMALE
jgi:hypothetical protein